MIKTHGDDLYKYEGQVKINFSSNIFSHANLSGLQAHLIKHIDVIRNYPEPEPYELEEMIAEKLGLQPQNIMVTNGVTEAIYLIANYFRGAKHHFDYPTFMEYEAATHHFYSLSGQPDTTVYWICNPNNPDGRVRDKDALEKQIITDPDNMYIVDQSYACYTDKPVLEPKTMGRRLNCALLYSMTKRYCVPGLRLGYIVSNSFFISRLRKERITWSVNALANEAGKYLLKHDIPNFPNLNDYLAETQRLRSELLKIKGVTVWETDTNFMVVRLSKYLSYKLKSHLLDDYGILVRDGSTIKGLGSHYIRIAAQMRKENDLLVSAIKKYMEGL